MTVRRNGMSFVVSLRARVSIDDVAQEVAAALEVPLRESDARGLQGDYVGGVVGLRLWLWIFDYATSQTPNRIALHGGPEVEFDSDAIWVDAGPYIAELLTERTGRSWKVGTDDDPLEH